MHELGVAGTSRLRVQGSIDVDVAEAAATWRGALTQVVAPA
jgi:hypothetical protein